jgi:hypothetical protein
MKGYILRELQLVPLLGPLLLLDSYECLDSLKVLGQADNH